VCVTATHNSCTRPYSQYVLDLHSNLGLLISPCYNKLKKSGIEIKFQKSKLAIDAAQKPCRRKVEFTVSLMTIECNSEFIRQVNSSYLNLGLYPVRLVIYLPLFHESANNKKKQVIVFGGCYAIAY
jgi:hypothetical protein